MPEPPPDRAVRWSLIRRASFVATATALTGAFAFSLSGIASTRGAVRPDGRAAAIAAAQQRDAASTADAPPPPRGHCHRGDHTRGGAVSGRV